MKIIHNAQQIQKIRNLLTSQRLAVIATEHKGTPYTNLVAFVVSNNLKNIIFSTNKNTLKFKNLVTNNKISILIDNRQNSPSDITAAITITAMGIAFEIQQNLLSYKELLLEKHPNLTDFVNLPDTTLIKVLIQRYILVDNFQEITIINIETS